MNNIKISAIHHHLFVWHLLLLGCLMSLTLLVTHFFPPLTVSLEPLLPQFWGGVQPKPIEKILFFMGVIALPVFSLGYIILKTPPQAIALNPSKKHQAFILAPLLWGAFSLVCFYHSDWLHFLFQGLGLVHTTAGLIICFISALFLSKLLCRPAHSRFRFYSFFCHHARAINWLIFLAMTLLLLLAWRLSSIQMADHSFRSTQHLDAILYAASQVIHGKTILVDLPSQYGLFPELLAPLFKGIGLSVFKFSLVMAGLQLLSLVAVFAVLMKLLKSQVLLFLGGLSLIILTFENPFYLAGFADPYYQYWPIRFFFPALSLWFFARFCQQKSLANSTLMSGIAAISVIWNLDTGLFIWLSYAIYLGTGILFSYLNGQKDTAHPARRDNFRYALVVHCLILLVVIPLFGWLLQYSAGEPLQYSWIYSYQVIFYKIGYGMLPLPRRPHPWMLVIILYLYGLNASLASFKYKLSYKAEIIYYLSLLGVGLFTYYEGRAHVANLFKVMWPALIISMFFADQIIRRIRVNWLHAVNLIFPSLVITVLLLCFALIVFNVSKLYADLKQQLISRDVFINPLILDELNFITANTRPGQACLLLLKNQANYYVEAGLYSPIKGPGLVETMLKTDIAAQSKQIMQTMPDCVFLGKNDSAFNPGYDYAALFKDYLVVKENKAKTVQLLRPRSKIFQG